MQCTCVNGGVAAKGTACPKHDDAKCVSCTGKYFLDEAVCKAWTNCATDSKTEKTQGSNTADAVCDKDFECKCINGSPATGSLCPKHGNNTCISCRGKYYLDNGACLPWQDCDKQGKVETQRGSNTANAQCGRAKQCECDYGTGATGTACPRDGDAKCIKCDASHWLGTDHKCQKWTDCDALGKQTTKNGTSTADSKCGGVKQCKCDQGVGASSKDCPSHGDPKCSSCTGKFFLQGVVCKPHTNCDALGRVQKAAGTDTADAICGDDKKCTCGNGFGATGTACPTDSTAKCVSCSSAFFLTSKAACQAHKDCDTDGKVQTKAGTSTNDAECGADKKCVCSHGTHTVGTGCPREGDAHCRSCAANYFLDGVACKPHTNCERLGNVEPSKGTGTKDAVCGVDKQCTCANGGVAAKGTACPKHNDAKCVSCTGKYFLDQAECKAWTDCGKQSKTEKTAGSNTADAVCGEDFQCKCINGSPATGSLCPTDGDAKCMKCDASHWLGTAHKCQKWTDCDALGKQTAKAGTSTADSKCGGVKQCKCAQGVGASSKDCPTHNAVT